MKRLKGRWWKDMGLLNAKHKIMHIFEWANAFKTTLWDAVCSSPWEQ
jgi:hypothetical protein